MEDLIIFRIFLTFPLIGLLIPDTGTLFSNVEGYIPVTHLITEATLLVCIIVCSIGIQYQKRKSGNEGSNDEVTAMSL